MLVALEQVSSIAPFVPETTTSVAAWRPTEFPHITLLDRAPDMLVCWRRLEEKLAVAYQVFWAPGTSFTILEGDLPRGELEKCVGEVLMYNQLSTADVHRDGELTVFATKLATVYAAWRGPYVILGSREAVTKALAGNPASTWGDAITELPGKDGFATTALVAIATDRTFANLLGVPTTRWKIIMEL